jgi:P27 family predicted phage terminase small subunit
MARPFLSEAEHALRGTEAHKSTVGGESPLAPGRPKWGRLPKECRTTFKRICKLLADRKHLTPGDREIISLYAVSEDRYWKFKEILDREGWTIEVQDEGTKDHPVAKHFYAAERVCFHALTDWA